LQEKSFDKIRQILLLENFTCIYSKICYNKNVSATNWKAPTVVDAQPKKG